MQGRATPDEPFSGPPARLVARLRMLVVDGFLAPDRPEPIDAVAAVLGVDERLAWAVLMELGRDGFLERVGEDRVRVRTLPEMMDAQVLQVRALVEPPAVRGAAEHARAVDLMEVRALAEHVEDAVTKHDHGEFRRCDDEFFAAWLALNPNVELARLCTELRQRTACDGLRAPVEWGVSSDLLGTHRRMVDLLEAGAFDALEDLSRTIVERLRFVGAPRMDAPYLADPPVSLVPDGDDGFPDPAVD